MKYIIQIIIIGLLANCTHASDQQAETIISRHKIIFEKPPQKIPNNYSVDAPLLGNGFTGISISGNPECQVFYIARNDFWRLKSALDESYPTVLGKIELSIPEFEDASYHIEQNLWDAVTTACFTKDERQLYYKAYVSATDDILVVEVGMKGPGTIDGTAKLELPGEKEIIEKWPRERKFPDVRGTHLQENGVSYIFRAFEDSVDIKTKAAVALRVIDSHDGKFSIKEGKPAVFTCAFSSNFKSENCVEDVIKKVEKYTPDQLGKLEKAHKEWWENYWERSYVSIPDLVIEKQYYVSLYGMASCSRDLNFPPSIFGTWITRERPGWNGDYHLNYNHMAPYYALYSANRIEQANPYYMPLLAQIPRGQYYSEKVTGVKDGILLPVGAGPLGIETTRRTPFMDKYFQQWITSGNIEDEGMFWGQKSNSSYAVVNMAMQFYRTWDVEYTKKVYPFVKGVATFWDGYLKYEDGRYVIYNDAIHEGSIGTKNPILSLGLVKLVMQTVVDMSELLGVDIELRDSWLHIEKNISKYPLQEREGKVVFRYTEEGAPWWNGNTLGIQHIYPSGQIGLASDPELLQIARNTIDVMHRWKDYNGTNSFFPAAVRVGYNPDTILIKMHQYSEHIYPNGFQMGNPHGIENLSTVPNTINEMLCMGHQGIVRFFAVWPHDKDAMFRNIRVEGAFLASGEISNGVIRNISITSEKGKELCLENPWPGCKIQFTSKEFTKIEEGDIVKFETTANGVYQITPLSK